MCFFVFVFFILNIVCDLIRSWEDMTIFFCLIYGFIVSSCLPRGNVAKQMAPAVKLSKKSE